MGLCDMIISSTVIARFAAIEIFFFISKFKTFILFRGIFTFVHNNENRFKKDFGIKQKKWQ